MVYVCIDDDLMFICSLLGEMTRSMAHFHISEILLHIQFNIAGENLVGSKQFKILFCDGLELIFS